VFQYNTHMINNINHTRGVFSLINRRTELRIPQKA